jgi:hypothetical protein
LHLRSEEKRVPSHNDEIINVGEDPEWRKLKTPEHTWISNGNREANGLKKGTKTTVPSQRGLLEAVDSLLELENKVFTGAIAGRRQHEYFLLQVASEEGGFDVKLVDQKVILNSM